MKPYIATAFRNPLLLLLPLILIPLLAISGGYLMGRRYQVSAAVWVQVPSLLSSGSATTTKSPAETEASAFNERMGTDSFLNQIISGAGLDEQAASGEWPSSTGLGKALIKFPLTKPFARFVGGHPVGSEEANRSQARDELAKTLRADARYNNLLRVTYTGHDGTAGVALVNAAIEAYRQASVGGASAQNQAVLQFYDDQVQQQQTELEAADSDLRTFEALHPVAPGVARSTADAQQIAQLQALYNVRLANYQAAISKQTDAQIRAATSVSSSNNGFVLVDAPTVPSAPQLALGRVMTIGMMGIIFALGLGGMLVALRTWSDQTLRRARDTEIKLNLPVLAVVPKLPRA